MNTLPETCPDCGAGVDEQHHIGIDYSNPSHRKFECGKTMYRAIPWGKNKDNGNPCGAKKANPAMNIQQQYLSEEAVRALCGKGEPHTNKFWPVGAFDGGWRPLLLGEEFQKGDEYYGSDNWLPRVDAHTDDGAQDNWCPTRTKRELPPEAQPDKPADGWIKWDGGECPVPKGTKLSVKFRGGLVIDEVIAGTFEGQQTHQSWSYHAHEAAWGKLDAINDIVAYKVIDNPAESLVGKTVWLTHKLGARYEVAVSKDARGFIHGDFKLWDRDEKEWSKNHGLGAFDQKEHTIHHSDPTKPEWRLMGDDEILEEGDEWMREGISDWRLANGFIGSTPNSAQGKVTHKFKARTRRPIPKPAPVREPNEILPDEIKVGMSFWASVISLPYLYKIHAVSKVSADEFHSGYTCLTHNSTYGDCLFTKAGYKFYSADPRETPAAEPAKVEAFVPKEGDMVHQRHAKYCPNWSSPFSYMASHIHDDIANGWEFRRAEEPKPTERQQKANDAAAAMRAVYDSYRTTQPEPNQNNMNAQQSNTATPDIGPLTVPRIGSEWMVNNRRLKVVAASPAGVALDSKNYSQQPSLRQWCEDVRKGDAIPIVTWRDRRYFAKISRQRAKVVQQFDSTTPPAGFVAYGPKKPLWKRIRNWTLSRGFYYSLGGLTGHLAASAILSAVAYLTSLWAQHIAK